MNCPAKGRCRDIQEFLRSSHCLAHFLLNFLLTFFFFPVQSWLVVTFPNKMLVWLWVCPSTNSAFDRFLHLEFSSATSACHDSVLCFSLLLCSSPCCWKKETVQCISMSEPLEAWKGEEALPGSDSLLQHRKGALAETETSRGQSQEVRESAHVVCTYYKRTDNFLEGCYHYNLPVIVLW